jgi:hypothetical protein
MNDFVYICKDGDNEELKYSIRSVISSFPDSNIWVVGGKPNWYVGNFIHVPQVFHKYRNAFENLKEISESDEISETFILMNDDFYIVGPLTQIETFHGLPLVEKVELYEKLNGRSPYTKKLRLTYERLIKLGINDPLDYELHVPMPMEKEKLKEVLLQRDTFLWRSIYGNMFNVGGKYMEDVKVYLNGALVAKSHDMKQDKSIYLSSSDSSSKYMISKILRPQFKSKTKFEK